MKTSERLLRYLLRLGIRGVLLLVGVFLVAGIYYSDGWILVDGWKWVQGLGEAGAEFFVKRRYFLGIGALLVFLVYGLWRVGWLRRRGTGFVLNRRCVLTDPYRHGLVVGSTGLREDGECGGALPEGGAQVRTRRGGLRLQVADPGRVPAFRGLAGETSWRPPDAGDPHPEHGRRPLFASLRSALHDPHAPARPGIGRCDHHRRGGPTGIARTSSTRRRRDTFPPFCTTTP